MVWGDPGDADHLGLLQVLERWCMSPRTIEVLMNTYSVVRLPEGAMGLVPPETLQVRLQDPDRTTVQPARETPTSQREVPLAPLFCPTEITQRPSRVPGEENSVCTP